MSDQATDQAYRSGYQASQAHDRHNLANVLHVMIETGEVRESVAREIYAAVHGATEAVAEFGADPNVERIIRGLL